MSVTSLNPCFTGICSLSLFGNAKIGENTMSLNPCFTGICSLRLNALYAEYNTLVLILVLLEYAL